MSVDQQMESETDTVALQLLINRDEKIAELFEKAAFPEEKNRETAKMVLDDVGSDYVINLLKKKMMNATYPSIIFNPDKFPQENLNPLFSKRRVKEHQVLYKRLKDIKNSSRLIGHTCAIKDLAMDKKGDFLISGSVDSNIKLWHLPTQTLVQTFKGHSDGITATAISPDRRLLISCSEDHSVRIWSLENGQAVCTVSFGDNEVLTGISFSPLNDIFAVASLDGWVRILKISDLPKEIETLDEKVAKSGDVLTHDDLFVVTDTHMRYAPYVPSDFIAQSLDIVYEKNLGFPINAIAFSPGGTMVGFAMDTGEAIIQSVTDNHTWRIRAHQAQTTGIKFLKNSPFKVITWTQKAGEIKLWNLNDLTEPEVTFVAPGVTRRIHFIDVQISNDETFIVTISTTSAFGWSLNSPTAIFTLETKEVYAAIAPHPIIPTVFALCTKSSVIIADLTKSEPINKAEVPCSLPKCCTVQWAPNGLQIYAGDTSGGIYTFRAQKEPNCPNYPQFFPTDFTASEWIPDKGQFEESTKLEIHQSPRNILCDSNTVQLMDNFAPVSLEEFVKPAIIDPYVVHMREIETAWLSTSPDLHIEARHRSKERKPKLTKPASLPSLQELDIELPKDEEIDFYDAEDDEKTNGKEPKKRGRKKRVESSYGDSNDSSDRPKQNQKRRGRPPGKKRGRKRLESEDEFSSDSDDYN